MADEKLSPPPAVPATRSAPRGAGGAIPADPAPEPARGAPRPSEPAAPVPMCPPGTVLYRNASEDMVVVELLDGDNRRTKVRVPPGDFGVFPLAYADLMPARAPQLREVARREHTRE